MNGSQRARSPARLSGGILGAVLAAASSLAAAQQAPAPNPPVKAGPPEVFAPKSLPQAPLAAPTTEWTRHKGNGGATPSGAEQKMLWLMNRARSNPTAEGAFLAAIDDPDVVSAVAFFNVDLALMQQELAQFPVRSPAAFDFALWEASEAHSQSLIARNAQDHTGQGTLVDATGVCAGWRISVFSFTESALHGHAALNIDWGTGGAGGMQSGRGHRLAIMGQPVSGNAVLSLTGLALVPESNPATGVGPLVFSGVYCRGDSQEQNRHVVGTVWRDANANGLYDEGEGISGVTASPSEGTYYAVTGQAGGYSFPVEAAGTYTVTFSGGGLGADVYTREVTVGTESLLLDIDTATDAPDQPPPPPVGADPSKVIPLILDLLEN
ncbi:MAG: hypothetical protein H6983_14965 [Ectothiorhodospiraceae bacterium]|nr:hypothetical protein [Chromatiales bacterium]MCP5155469.1 hypothetical protein [Ectothiorhodospiraceae bacterium]